MNFRLVLKLVGRVTQLVSCSMLFPLLISLIWEEDPRPFLYSIVILLLIGTGLYFIPTNSSFYLREGFFAVGLIWIFMGLAGALPFFFSGCFPSFLDCAFESFSGFSTTGVTVLTDIEALPQGILFWRSLTHWLGGMGVLVLATAVVPSMGIRSHYLTQAESPGPVASKLVPKQAQSSRILYRIYCALTAIEVVLLRLTGLPLYDCFIHAFSTAGTGGFSNRNGNVGAYNNPAAEMVIAIFLLLFSLNFAIHFLILTRRFRQAFSSDELRFFLCLIFLVTAYTVWTVQPVYNNVWDCLRHSFFMVCSVISTTGFTISNYSAWPQAIQVCMLLLMLIGGCAGSTTGGLKCSRVLLAFRSAHREISHILHPRAVKVVKLDGKVVGEGTLHSVLTYIACFFAIVFVSTLLIASDDFSFATCFSAALTCVSNAGPGLELAGPTGNYSAFSPFVKVFLSLCMVVGRLEIFPVLVILSPKTWRKI